MTYKLRPPPPQRKEGPVYLPTHGVCLCLRPNLIGGGGGGLYTIFDLVLEAKIAVPAVSPHLTLYCWNSYFGLQYQFKNDI